jgi:Right handed beta helix region
MYPMMRLTWHVPLIMLLVAPRCGSAGGSLSGPEPPPPPVTPPGPPPPGPPEPPPPPPIPSAACAGYRFTRLVPVGTATQLATAIARAEPGDLIQLSDGHYVGGWTITVSGTEAAPIVLCGSSSAVLDAGSVSSRDVLTLKASWWTLGGFAVTNGLRGVYTERASHNTLERLTIHDIGQEAVHWRVFSSHNVVRNSSIRSTGLINAEFGEGIYIGQWRGHWSASTGGQPDRSDSNSVIDNVIGPAVTAEHVDAKEGTTGGRITGNTFDGRGMALAQPWVDSWVEINGNNYVVSGNTGSSSPRDGFQVMVGLSGWGNENRFERNVADVGADGFGFRIDRSATGNVVTCDNIVEGAGAGFSNTDCR